MATIGIIVGSTRPGRFGTQPAEWLKKISAEHPENNYEIVAVADFKLPILDESKPAMMMQYEHDHTKTWSNKIASFDGYIFVTPEYNHTVAASLTNAIDYLYHEWVAKPVAFVSYGAEGGGGRAIEHLRAIVGHLGMFDLSANLMIHNYYHHFDTNGIWQANVQQTEKAHKILNDIGFWAEKFNPIRTELASA
jgi:NAD(P)H-dependent FMN reductase